MHLTGATGLSVKAATLSDLNFHVDALESSVIVTQGTTSVVTSNDASVNRSISSTVDNRFDISVVRDAGLIDPLYAAVVTVTGGTLAGNTVTRIADGTCVILVATPWLTKAKSVMFARTGGATTDSLMTYVAGSLAKHITDAMTTLTAGKTSADIPMYTTLDHTTPAYVRNAACWAASIDMTALSVWNSALGGLYAGTAITPRHIIYASHFAIPVGTTLRFVTNTNAIVTRTLTASYVLPSSNNRDTTIGLLDSGLPGSITPVKLLPSNFANYIPSVEKFRLDIIAMNYRKNVLAKQLVSLQYVTGTTKYLLLLNSNSHTTLDQSIISGDSGHPSFVLVNGVLVLLSLWSGGTNGPAFHAFLSEIDAGLASLGGGYSVSTVSLAGFNVY